MGLLARKTGETRTESASTEELGSLLPIAHPSFSHPAALSFTGERYIPGHRSRWLREAHEERYGFAARYARGHKVLDIACGSGYGTEMLGRAGASLVHGVDVDEDALAFARTRPMVPNVSYHRGGIEDFQSRERYGLIVSYETIEHVDDYAAALVNLRELMTDDGVLLISSPNRLLSSPGARLITDKPENPFHVREFTASELLVALGQSGFASEGCQVFGQGFQLDLSNWFLNKAVRKVFTRPFANLAVRPLERVRKPSYFVIVARKRD